MAQNIPDLLTVSLEEESVWMASGIADEHRSVEGCSPAVDHNGFVVSPTLHLVHFLHHSNDGLWTGTLAMRIPVLYLKLCHLMSFARLHVRSK